MISASFITGNYNNYRITRQIFEGGMGVAYEGIDSSNKSVIIKAPAQKNDSNDILRRTKLEIEAKILRELLTPGNNHIVKYIDESRTNNNFYLILEKLSDDTLKNKVSKRGPIDEQTAINYLQALLNGLRYIHSKNILHRDIKPGNILFNAHGQPVFIDFGAAKDGYNDLTQFRSQNSPDVTQIGSPPWTCPHQMQGFLTSSCDLYALGVVLFYMLTGVEPIKHMNAIGCLSKKPREIRSGINKNISDLVDLMVDPNHTKISTVDDVSNYLRQGSVAAFGNPCIVINGVKHEIHDEIDIGRFHGPCDNSCFQIGFKTSPKITITEGNDKFVSKHHARIWKDKNGYCWIQDLKSKNGTAIYRSGSYRLLSPGQKELLLDKSLVALCFNPQRGAYLTFTFHEK